MRLRLYDYELALFITNVVYLRDSAHKRQLLTKIRNSSGGAIDITAEERDFLLAHFRDEANMLEAENDGHRDFSDSIKAYDNIIVELENLS